MNSILLVRVLLFPALIVMSALSTTSLFAVEKTANVTKSPTAKRSTPQTDILSAQEWQQTDKSVELGLSFLASQQRGDGGFNTAEIGQPGVTALVVLAFMQHGHLPGEGPYGQVLKQAIEFLISCQKKNGLFARVYHEGPLVPTPMDNFMVSVAASYNHPITSLTLSELYGMTGESANSQLEPSIRKALDVSLDIQKWKKQRPIDIGGWRYLHRYTKADSDLSITGWHLKFLRSAKNSGFDLPPKAIDDAIDYVRRCFTPEFGTFEYNITENDRRTRAMAGAGILALAHAGQHNREELIPAADWILKHGFSNYNQRETFGTHHEQSDRYHYGVFYCCQAMYQIGGKYWEEFFPPTVKTLLANQNRDGSWDAEKILDRQFGKSYTTSLVLLALGCPNQLLPIYQR